MKKFLLFLLPIMALSLASCEKNNEKELSGDDVIEFKDPNFLKALLIVRETSIYDDATGDWIPYTMDVDGNKDGVITVNEAKRARALDVSATNWDGGEYDENEPITDMTEIKYFTSIEDLNCAYNNISSLDLSHNTSLKRLTCWHTPLTSLDVSKNTSLVFLDIEDNQLESLNIDGCNSLREIACSNNKLTELDLNGKVLTLLWCDVNKLTVLDLSSCSPLIELGISYNPLRTLIISEAQETEWKKNGLLDSFKNKEYYPDLEEIIVK